MHDLHPLSPSVCDMTINPGLQAGNLGWGLPHPFPQSPLQSIPSPCGSASSVYEISWTSFTSFCLHVLSFHSFSYRTEELKSFPWSHWRAESLPQTLKQSASSIFQPGPAPLSSGPLPWPGSPPACCVPSSLGVSLHCIFRLSSVPAPPHLTKQWFSNFKVHHDRLEGLLKPTMYNGLLLSHKNK